MKRNLKKFTLFLTLAVIILFCLPGNIFAPPSSIQDMINNSPAITDPGPGMMDNIVIPAGTYIENLVIDIPSGNTLNLQGSGKTKTIIDGSGNTAPAISIHGNGAVRISDLTINNGEHSYGAGILNEEGVTVIIDNCNITKNHATSMGGGIYNSGSANFNIENSTISDNYAASGYSAGGIYNSGTMIISKSILKDNYSGDGSLSGTGGGILNTGSLTIHDSSIIDNRVNSPSGWESSGIHVYSTLNAQNNWWGSSSGPYNPTSNPGGKGDAVLGDVAWGDYYPWLTSNPFGAEATEASGWVRPMPMTCWQVWINKDNNFQFIFWYPYKDKNWVRIYDMEGNMVYEVDMPYHDPNLIVDLPDGLYNVKTFHDQELLQEFLIGKP